MIYSWCLLSLVACAAPPPNSLQRTKSALLLPMHCAWRDRYFKGHPSHLHTRHCMPSPNMFLIMCCKRPFIVPCGRATLQCPTCLSFGLRSLLFSLCFDLLCGGLPDPFALLLWSPASSSIFPFITHWEYASFCLRVELRTCSRQSTVLFLLSTLTVDTTFQFAGGWRVGFTMIIL